MNNLDSPISMLALEESCYELGDLQSPHELLRSADAELTNVIQILNVKKSVVAAVEFLVEIKVVVVPYLQNSELVEN